MKTTKIRVRIVDKEQAETWAAIHGTTIAEELHIMVEKIRQEEAALGHEIRILPQLEKDMRQ
jgi:hypothetical protein